MKKLSGGIIALIVIAAIVIIALIFGVSAYNGLAQARESVSSADVYAISCASFRN